MKKRNRRILSVTVCGLLPCLLFLLLLSACTPPADVGTDPTLGVDASVEGASATDQNTDATRKTYRSWRTFLHGTPIELGDRPEHDLITPGCCNYFYCEVIQSEPDYLVVTPRVDIPDDSYLTYPSHTPELLAVSDRYIIPRAWAKQDYIEQDEACVGDILRIEFVTTRVVTDTEYGKTPVVNVIASVELVTDKFTTAK